jgi:sterol desaturase/sphingolipid hydroxylase (fatty acid hydroxylase superfamily)
VSGARDELRRRVSPRYSGRAHLAFTLVSSLAVAALLLAGLRAVRPWEIAVAPAFFLLCSLLEYLEHRFLLHRRTRAASFAFEIHTLEHHRFFTDESYHPDDRRDFAFILFPPRLVAGYMLLVVPLFAAPAWLWLSPNAGRLVGATAALFFFAYEVIHLASHLGERFPIRPRFLCALAEHHRVHHRTELMTAKNFNVVMPLFDRVFGTRAR